MKSWTKHDRHTLAIFVVWVICTIVAVWWEGMP